MPVVTQKAGYVRFGGDSLGIVMEPRKTHSNSRMNSPTVILPDCEISEYGGLGGSFVPSTLTCPDEKQIECPL